MIIIIIMDWRENVNPVYNFKDSLTTWRSLDMELKYDKNNQLIVRLAIVESQLKCAKDQIELLKNKNLACQAKPFQVK
jgi:hypothetical protein